MAITKSAFLALTEKDRMNRVLEGTAFYASVHNPNMSAAKKFGADPAFMISLGLEGDQIKLAESFGLKIMPADEFINMPYVKLKRTIREGKTPDEVKPLVVDAVQNKVPPHILIGNGSKVLCKFGTYWYDTNGGGVGTSLFKVQVRELVPYAAPTTDRDLKMDAGGFKVPANSEEAAKFDDDDGFVAPAQG